MRGAGGSRPVVLIGFAEALAAPEVVFSLRHAGFAVRPFARAGAPPSSIARLPIEPQLTLPPPEADARAAVAALRNAAASTAPAAILPLDQAFRQAAGQLAA